jgi:chromosome segregation ATPase
MVCNTPKFEDYEMERAFLLVANRLLVEKNNYVAEYQEKFLPLIADTSRMEEKLNEFLINYNEMVDEAEELVKSNATRAQDQSEYQKRFDSLASNIKAKSEEIDATKKEISDAKVRKENARIFLDALQGMDSLLQKFDIALWHRLVDYVTVTPDKELVFHLRSGREMTILLEDVH